MGSQKIDWSKYNKELVNRGSITLWFDLDDEKEWYAKNEDCRKGRPFTYSWIAIELLCLLGCRFGLTLRSLQGFGQSILNLMGVNVKVPNYSTIGRRMANLDVSIISKIKKKGAVDIAIDSSGLKVYGEGEWKVKIHGRQKHRTWRKLHLTVDSKNNKIINAVLTTNNFKDSEVFSDLLKGIDNAKSVSADGAYDSMKCYEIAENLGIQPVIPPRKNAKISRRGSEKSRDTAIREIRADGRKNWKINNGYHKRSLSETAFSRMKRIMGDKLRSRKFENQATETFIKCKILNKMITPKGYS